MDDHILRLKQAGADQSDNEEKASVYSLCIGDRNRESKWTPSGKTANMYEVAGCETMDTYTGLIMKVRSSAESLWPQAHVKCRNYIMDAE